MSTRNRYRQIQGSSHSTFTAYEIFQDEITAKQPGLKCTVVVTPQHISIRTENYPDFLLARSAIKGMTSLDIIRSI